MTGVSQRYSSLTEGVSAIGADHKPGLSVAITSPVQLEGRP